MTSKIMEFLISPKNHEHTKKKKKEQKCPGDTHLKKKSVTLHLTLKLIFRKYPGCYCCAYGDINSL